MKANDKNKQIDIDFSKVFDIVPHDILLTMLHQYAIRGKILGWLKEFLPNREQSDVVEGMWILGCHMAQSEDYSCFCL